MKLLIIMQALDTEHSILGFFHGWVAEFANQVESVEVIALQVGKYNLPPNVRVHSLGKETGQNRLKYLWRWYSYLWQLRGSYDSVFVHMNQQYVPLGYPVWKILGKHIGLWYAHGAISASLKYAVRLADVVFTSTPQGLQIDTPKRVIVGQGIDYEHFASTAPERSESFSLQLITVGRISASKNVDTLLAACLVLKQANVSFHFSIVGSPLTSADESYAATLRTYCDEHNLLDNVTWVGGVNQIELPAYLHNADIFIHDGGTQSLDKVLLESAAAGCVVISSNAAYAAFTTEMAPQYVFPAKDATALAALIQQMQPLTKEERTQSMKSVVNEIKREHSIQGLITRIVVRL